MALNQLFYSECQLSKLIWSSSDNRNFNFTNEIKAQKK